MKNDGGHFTPKFGGHFELESGGHFKLELGGQYHWNLHPLQDMGLSRFLIITPLLRPLLNHHLDLGIGIVI